MPTKLGFDKFFVRLNDDGTPWGYIYVDTSKTLYFEMPKKDGFRRTVEFPVQTYRGEGNVLMPVVFTDFTTTSGDELQEIAEADIPKGIKQRYVRWEKLQ